MKIKLRLLERGMWGSIATLLAQHNEVTARYYSEKVDQINAGISPIHDDYIEKFLKEKS